MKYIYIEVDTNDADYVGVINPISDRALEKIMPLIEAIKNFEPYTGKSTGYEMEWKHCQNYPTGECLREDLGEKSPEQLYDFPEGIHDLFQDYCPRCEWGFHTIKEISIFNKVEQIL